MSGQAVVGAGADPAPASEPVAEMAASSASAPEPMGFETDSAASPDPFAEEPAAVAEFDQSPAPTPPEPMDPLGEIRDFGNAVASTFRDGNLQYTLIIRGVDSKDLRSELLACLQDEKFGWNINEIDESIREGTLRLPDLSPAKAHVIINRIKYLPFDVDWLQHEVTLS
jgi:hypothetical protein